MTNLPVNVRIKLAAETTYTCDVCGKKYVRKALFKKHMQTKHIDPIVRQSIATQIPALGVRTTSVVQNIPQILDSPGPPDDAMNSDRDETLENSNQSDKVDIDLTDPHRMVEEESDCTLEEMSEVVEEIGPQPIESNWQCGECGQLYYSTQSLKEHVEQTHTKTPKPISRVIVLTPDNCKECKKKEGQQNILQNNLEKKKEDNEVIFKELDLLKRRHDIMKQKYNDLNKDNKKYAKELVEALK